MCKIFGEDLDVLKEKSDEIVRAVSTVKGARDVRAEQIAGLPVLQIEIDRGKIARYGINVADVLDMVEIAVAGKVAGEVFEGMKRFDLVLRYPERYRNSPDLIGNIVIISPEGKKVPLTQLVKKIAIEEGPAQISHEQAQRRVVIEANVRGRDIGSFVAEAKETIKNKVHLPPGYALEWGGQFKNLESARLRLMIVVPITLFLILFLLFRQALKPW